MGSRFPPRFLGSGNPRGGNLLPYQYAPPTPFGYGRGIGQRPQFPAPTSCDNYQPGYYDPYYGEHYSQDVFMRSVSQEGQSTSGFEMQSVTARQHHSDYVQYRDGSNDQYGAPQSRQAIGYYQSAQDESYRTEPGTNDEDNAYWQRAPPSSAGPSYRQPPTPRAADDGYRQQPPPRPADDGYHQQPPPRPADDGYRQQPPPRGVEEGYRSLPPCRPADDGYRQPAPPPRAADDGYRRPAPRREADDGYRQPAPDPCSADDGNCQQPPPHAADDGNRQQPPPPCAADDGNRQQHEHSPVTALSPVTPVTPVTRQQKKKQQKKTPSTATTQLSPFAREEEVQSTPVVNEHEKDLSRKLPADMEKMIDMLPDSPRAEEEEEELQESNSPKMNLTDEEVLEYPSNILTQADKIRHRKLLQRIRQRRYIKKMISECGLTKTRKYLNNKVKGSRQKQKQNSGQADEVTDAAPQPPPR